MRSWSGVSACQRRKLNSLNGSKARPRYQLYIYLFFLKKFLVIEGSMYPQNASSRRPVATPLFRRPDVAQRFSLHCDIATFSRLVKTFSLRATTDLYSCRNSDREIRACFGVAGRFNASRSFANSASQLLKTAAGSFPA